MTDQDKITVVLTIGEFESLLINDENAKTFQRLSVLKMYIKDIDQVIDRMIKQSQIAVDDKLLDSQEDHQA